LEMMLGYIKIVAAKKISKSQVKRCFFSVVVNNIFNLKMN
jgi:hypothetical protein